MQNPEVSIIIPVYNRENLISDSLASIKAQTFQNWECIIVDDHSTDNTITQIGPFLEDKRFSLYKRPNNRNKGANACRNFGLEKSSGKFIHWFDSDDLVHPNCLSLILEVFKKNHVDFCHFKRSIFRGEFENKFKNYKSPLNHRKVDHRDIEDIVLNNLSFNTCNVIWRKSSLKSEKFNENIIYADEWEFYTRLILNGLNGISISNELFFGGKHSDSTTHEFYDNHTGRRESKIVATLIVMEELNKNQKFSEVLYRYFLHLGYFLRSTEIIKFLMDIKKANFFKRNFFLFCAQYYDQLKPLLEIKSKIT